MFTKAHQTLFSVSWVQYIPSHLLSLKSTLILLCLCLRPYASPRDERTYSLSMPRYCKWSLEIFWIHFYQFYYFISTDKRKLILSWDVSSDHYCIWCPSLPSSLPFLSSLTYCCWNSLVISSLLALTHLNFYTFLLSLSSPWSNSLSGWRFTPSPT
jgi:hypothetical protein